MSDERLIKLARKKGQCPRVYMRMECPECGYPLCDARYGLEAHVPHEAPKSSSKCITM